MLKNRFQPFQVGLNYETLKKHARTHFKKKKGVLVIDFAQGKSACQKK